MAQDPIDQEMDLTEGEIDLEGLGQALGESIHHSQAARSETDSSEEASDSDETDAVPRRSNTLASTSTAQPDPKDKRTTLVLLPNLILEQIQQIIGALPRGTKKPKIKK